MKSSYALVVVDGAQTGNEDSFVGGKPKLPAGLGVPQCALCGEPQTFFLQIAFPSNHAWTGYSIAIFACTSCAGDNYLIPEMLSGSLHGADVPATFLAAYQRNFRFLVFKTGTGSLVTNFSERVRFHPLWLASGSGSTLGHVGGDPNWVLEDEAPDTISSTSPAIFLLQLSPDVEFETVAGAPRQMEIGLDGTPELSPESFYRLFIGNTTYLFGPDNPAPDTVYAITQIA